MEDFARVEQMVRLCEDAWKKPLPAAYDLLPLRLSDMKNLVPLKAASSTDGSELLSAVYQYGSHKDLMVVKGYNLFRLGRQGVAHVGRYCEVLWLANRRRGAVGFRGAFLDGPMLFLAFENCTRGDVMRNTVRRGGRMDEDDLAMEVLVPVLLSLSALHSTDRIVHRDLKPENFLVGADGVVRIGGLTHAVWEERERPKSPVGTVDFMSPEMLRCIRRPEPGPATEDKKDAASAAGTAGAGGDEDDELVIKGPHEGEKAPAGSRFSFFGGRKDKVPAEANRAVRNSAGVRKLPTFRKLNVPAAPFRNSDTGKKSDPGEEGPRPGPEIQIK